jgi:hypothetical protein
MGLYNFQARFVPMILSGAKTHTIRAIRKHPDKPGNVLHLFTGLRRKGARLLMRTFCAKVEEIEIRREKAMVDPPSGDVWYVNSVFIDGIRLSVDEREALARRDGFRDFCEMMEFWEGRLPFRGHIVHWRTESTLFPSQLAKSKPLAGRDPSHRRKVRSTAAAELKRSGFPIRAADVIVSFSTRAFM